MERLIPGHTYTLEVVREAPFGYFLSNGKEDILLHHSEVMRPLEIGEEIEVFLYQDKKGRIAASMTIPPLTGGRFAWCTVVETKPELGIFIDIGLSKDILIHRTDLPKVQAVWPLPGDELYCTLKIDNYGNLLGKIAKESDLQPLFKPASMKDFNKNVTGRVYRTLRSGTFVITEEGYRGFIHASQRKIEPRLGQRVSGRIIDVKADGAVNISLLERSHEVIGKDAEKIYRYLIKHGGKMPYGDRSTPDDIVRQFGISKSAFKRALGHLLKMNKVEQKNGWTYLRED